MNGANWEKFLLEINVQAEGDIKLVTEAALFASLIDTGGTRSEEGQKCRDTFVSLKKTCVKLEITLK
jgi:hypothetical protein